MHIIFMTWHPTGHGSGFPRKHRNERPKKKNEKALLPTTNDNSVSFNTQSNGLFYSFNTRVDWWPFTLCVWFKPPNGALGAGHRVVTNVTDQFMFMFLCLCVKRKISHLMIMVSYLSTTTIFIYWKKTWFFRKIKKSRLIDLINDFVNIYTQIHNFLKKMWDFILYSSS